MPTNGHTLTNCLHCGQPEGPYWLLWHRGLCLTCWGRQGLRKRYPVLVKRRRLEYAPHPKPPPYEPTTDEIRAACAAERAAWDEERENARRAEAYQSRPMVLREQRLMGA